MYISKCIIHKREKKHISSEKREFVCFFVFAVSFWVSASSRGKRAGKTLKSRKNITNVLNVYYNFMQSIDIMEKNDKIVS